MIGEFSTRSRKGKAVLSTLITAAEHVAEEVRDAAEGRLEQEFVVGTYLPRKHAHRYDVEFFERFGKAVASVASKLKSNKRQLLASTAEELALNAIKKRAEILVDMSDVDGATGADPEVTCEALNDAVSDMQEDEDFLMLFDDSLDGFESGDASERLGMVNLEIKDWFTPFAGREPR